MARMSRITPLVILSLTALRAQASPFATELISYTAGTNSSASFRNAASALGEPSHTTSSGAQDVTIFNPPFSNTQIVSIGAGGSLIVKFDQPIFDNPTSSNWGIDFLVFGNTLYTNSAGKVGAPNPEPGHIAVSQDGITFVDITTAFADTPFPTMGFTDSTLATGKTGTTLSDFTKPVDPSLNPTGLTLAQLEAAYAGSGGGTGVDIASTGLPWIQYVEVYQPSTDAFSTEVDGFAIVSPEPASVSALLLFTTLACVRRRRSH